MGTARVYVYGTGEYGDCSGEAAFAIKLPDGLPRTFTVTSEYDSVAFSNGAKRPDAVVKIGDTVLTRNVDYILAYSNNTDVGTAVITANGIGNYKGISGSTTFEITNKVVKMTVTASPDKISYTGEPVTTGVTVLAGKLQLTEGKDYTLTYVNNTEVGTAEVIASGIGNYAGSEGRGTFEITEPDIPRDIGASLFSGWTCQLSSWYSGLFSIMNFDLENGRLTVEHRSCRPHDNFSTAYASIEVYDTKGSRCYSKAYIGNKNNAAPTDTVQLGLGYKVKLYVAEPTRGQTAVYANAAPDISMRPKSAEYIVTARGLREITTDGSTAADDPASQYAAVLYAYMDRLKAEHPEQEDFTDSTKFPAEKAAVEQGVLLLSAEELAQFTKDYEGYYPFCAPVDAQAPADITLLSADYEIGQQAAALDGTTAVSDGGTITYQWYRAAGPDDFTGTAIENAVQAVYTPDTAAAGTYYFFVTATNTNENVTGSKTAAITSSMAVITVTKPAFNGSGGGAGGGGAPISPSYSINAPTTANGSVTVPGTASKGSTVTITVKPDAGYALGELSVTGQNGNRLTLTDRGNGQYSFTMPEGEVRIAAVFGKIEEKPVTFRDVPADAYYASAVQWAVKANITTGTSAETFSPDAPCTRAQMVTFLWRAAGCPAPKHSGMAFADVDRAAYYYDAVLWAVEQGITNGTAEMTFSPDTAVTRGQTAALLYRAAGSPETEKQADFIDVAADAYYADAVAWAEENGIADGIGNARFDPNGICTRGQIAAFLYRAQK